MLHGQKNIKERKHVCILYSDIVLRLFLLLTSMGAKRLVSFPHEEHKKPSFHLPNENHSRYEYSFNKVNLQVLAEFYFAEPDICLL